MRLRAWQAEGVGCRCRTARGSLLPRAASACTEFGQGPVDELHVIENKDNRVLLQELTLFSPSVVSLSFFERFRTVFPVGGESGAQAQLTAVRTAKKAGIAGQRSWFREAHTPRLLGSDREPEQRQPRRWRPHMGSQAEAAIPQADAERRWPGRRTPAGIGRRADLYSSALRVGKPAGAATETGARAPVSSGEANRELAAIPRRERGKRRRRGSEGLLASCWPKRTGIVKGENESRGELDGDRQHGFSPAGQDRSCRKRPRWSVYPVDG